MHHFGLSCARQQPAAMRAPDRRPAARRRSTFAPPLPRSRLARPLPPPPYFGQILMASRYPGKAPRCWWTRAPGGSGGAHVGRARRPTCDTGPQYPRRRRRALAVDTRGAYTAWTSGALTPRPCFPRPVHTSQGPCQDQRPYCAARRDRSAPTVRESGGGRGAILAHRASRGSGGTGRAPAAELRQTV